MLWINYRLTKILSSAICCRVTVDEVAIALIVRLVIILLTCKDQVALRFQSIDCLSVHSSFNCEHTRSNSSHLLFYSYYSYIYWSSNSVYSGLKIPVQRLCYLSYCSCNLIIFRYIQCTLWCGGNCTDNWKKHGKFETYSLLRNKENN